jgi:hypothetical protein
MTMAYMQKREDSRRLGKQHRAKEATGWAEVGLGWSFQAGRPSPLQGPVGPPLTKTPLGLFIAPDREPCKNSLVIRRRGAEKLEGHHLRGKGGASCLGSP